MYGPSSREIEINCWDHSSQSADVDKVELPSDSIQSDRVAELVKEACTKHGGQIDGKALSSEGERQDLRTG